MPFPIGKSDPFPAGKIFGFFKKTIAIADKICYNQNTIWCTSRNHTEVYNMKYETPVCEILAFDVADIITTSGGDIGDTPAIDVTNIGA